MTSSRNRRFSRQYRTQRGVALMVALVMLVIIGIASVSVMRGAMSSDLVANNTRVQSLAMQAAQIALRYCEDEVVKLKTGIASPVRILASQDQWNTFESWGDENMVNEIPSQYMESDNSTFVPSSMPQCMVESSMLSGIEIFEITARGFSPDYSADEQGNTETGSVVWLQSTMRL